ncbi:hypothetical protein KCG43_20245 [Photobacterium sp. WH24]|uniref:hypothetical protein n=1 Tax=Photobacterium sp. WH24 TaxID=2827237 RepID=UPI001C473D7E|nr:hypothetical protein [Photobacterium sp. WH24]MBV7264346.1 hypothetical protein [Photobacterium sp. WH24]
MTNDEQQQLDELRASQSLTPAQKAKLKSLERKEKKAHQNDTPKTKRNATFGIVPTTELVSLPFRISPAEKQIMIDRRNAIKSEDAMLEAERLGGKDDLSNNMQMRAALWLMKSCSNEEVIEAIREVKLSMIRGRK